jgi:competence protein ComEC
VGLASGFQQDVSLLIPLAALSTCAFFLKKLPFYLAFFCLAFFYGKISQESFPSQSVPLQGIALFSCKSVDADCLQGKKTYKVKGIIRSFQEEGKEIAAGIPCTIPISPSLVEELSSAYLIRGSLEKQERSFSFTPDPQHAWVAKKSLFPLVKWRFYAKQFLSQKIKDCHSNQKVADFLIALTLGDLQDRHLRFAFNRLGLQHILAISGFHFGLLILFFSFFFRRILKERYAQVLLAIFLSLYFLLLGNSPSILRAYLAILLLLIARFCKKRHTALNIFSLTLLLELIFCPQNIHSLGFQLSFLATGSILVLSPVTLSWMEKLLPTRSCEQIEKFCFYEKIVIKACSFLRSTFAINVAVQLTLIPTCLFCFGSFPLASLIYNLFIPLAVSFSLYMFLITIPLFFFLPPLAKLFQQGNELFTGFILKMLQEAPGILHSQVIHIKVAKPLLFLLLLGAFFLPFFASSKKLKLFEF